MVPFKTDMALVSIFETEASEASPQNPNLKEKIEKLTTTNIKK